MSTYDLDGVEHLVIVCLGSSCRKHGGFDVLTTLKAEVKELGLRSSTHVVRARCLGRCDDACNVVIVGSRSGWYGGVTPKAARRIAREHVKDRTPVDELLAYAMSGGRLNQVGRGKRGKPRKA